MANWIVDTSRLSFAAARLALMPGTEAELQQLEQFADYLEMCAAVRLQMFHEPHPRAPTPYPRDAMLRRGAPMRPQSMTSTPPPPMPMSDVEIAFISAPNTQASQAGPSNG